MIGVTKTDSHYIYLLQSLNLIDIESPQDAVLKGHVCSYCYGQTEYVYSLEVYSKSYDMIYLCRPCKAWVGVHEGTDMPLAAWLMKNYDTGRNRHITPLIKLP
jgi:hypothetical protein